MDEVLPLFTSSPAAALKLAGKGHLREQADADLVIATRERLDIRYVLAKGETVYATDRP